MTVAVPYEPTTLDPHAENTVSNFAILSNVYEALVTTDEDLKIQPGLAATWESPDLLTWIFHLRPSVSFHRGRPLRAADVVYTFKRILRDPSLGMRPYLLGVSDVTEVDGLTVRIRTLRPARMLLNKLNFILVVPEGATPEALARSADGTGPYALAEWRPGDRVRLLRNDSHWAGRPLVPEVYFALSRSPEEAIEGLLAGRYQLIQCNSKKVEALVEPRGRYTVLRRDNIYLKYLGYDLSRDVTPFCRVAPNPFKNRLVRLAIDAAIDRRSLVARLSNYGTPATQPLPRFIFGFNPRIPEPLYDPERGRALLREAGLGKGFDVTLHVRRLYLEAALVLKEQLAPVGIGADLRVVSDPEFFEAMSRHDASFWLSRWGCPTGDASDLLDVYVHSPDAVRNFGMSNYGGYSNPALDRAIDRSTEIESVDDRRKALQQILATVVDERVLIPLYNDQDVYALERSIAWRPRNDSYIRAADIAPRR